MASTDLPSVKDPDVVKIPAPIIFAITMFVTGKSPSLLSSSFSVLLSFKKKYLLKNVLCFQLLFSEIEIFDLQTHYQNIIHKTLLKGNKNFKKSRIQSGFLDRKGSMVFS